MKGKLNSTSFVLSPVYSKPQLTECVFTIAHQACETHAQFGVFIMCVGFYIEYKHTFIYIYTYT